MKPITKKYHSKDLNIAYNDGLEEGRERTLKEELEFLLKLVSIYEDYMMYIGQNFITDLEDDEYLRSVNYPLTNIKERIAKIKKELGRKW